MNEKKNRFFPFIIAGLFLFSFPAYGATLIDINNLSQPGQNDTGWVNAMQGFKPKVNNINAFSTWNNSDTLNQTLTFSFYICKGTTTQSQLIFNSRSTSTEVEYGCGTTSPAVRILNIATTTMTDPNAGTNNGTTTINFPTTFLEIGQPYYFVMHYLSGQRNIKPSLNYNTYLATSSDVFFFDYWWNGQQRQTDNSGGVTGIDMPFATWYDFATNEAKITLTRPVVGERVLDNNPIVIEGSLYNPDVRYSTGIIKILNKQTWTALDDIVMEISTSSGTFSFTLPFGQLGAGNFRIYANLVNPDTGITGITSNVIDFVIGTNTVYTGTGDAQYIKGGEMSEAQICGTISTSTFFGAFECAGKKLIYYSLTPNEFAMETIKTSYTNFKGAFPFNVYFQLTDTVNNAISSTTVDRNDTFDIVSINTQGEFITIPVLSSSSLAKTVGNNNATLIRNTIGWLMWLGVAYLIYIQFRII